MSIKPKNFNLFSPRASRRGFTVSYISALLNKWMKVSINVSKSTVKKKSNVVLAFNNFLKTRLSISKIKIFEFY